MKEVYYLNLIDKEVAKVTRISKGQHVSRIIYDYFEIYVDNSYLFEKKDTALMVLKTKLDVVKNMLKQEINNYQNQINRFNNIEEIVENNLKLIKK